MGDLMRLHLILATVLTISLTPSVATSTASHLNDLLEIYNPSRIASTWTYDNSTDCLSDLSTFFSAYENSSLWAMQMVDASGSYNGQFFWGNNFWMGSSTLCYNLPEMAPFSTGFFVLKANIDLGRKYMPNERSYYVGACLPLSCSTEEVESLAVKWQRMELNPHRSLNLTLAKSPHNRYEMTEDPTFWILAITTIIVALLVVAGTGAELYQDYLSERRKRSKYFYDNYSYEIAKSAVAHHREVITSGQPQTVPPTSVTNNNTTTANLEEGGAEISENTSVDSVETKKRINLDFISVEGGWMEALLAFSAKRNLMTICDKSVGDDTIPTIHGLRSISMAWVILGHTCIVAFKYSDNTKYRTVVEKEFLFQTINNGPFSVDTFFFISGLLFSFIYFRTTAKHDISKITKTTGIKMNILEFIGMIFYRFFRLTTPYFFVLGVVQINSKWFHYNSVFEPPAQDYINCPNYWWRNLLYINTLFPVQDMCMLWSWYLADDTQFYILGAILLIIAVKYFRVAFGFFLLFLVSSWITTGYIAYTNEHIPNMDDPLALFDKIYDKPWTRLGPYMVGMAVGYILFRTDCKIKMSKTMVVLGWTLSFGTLMFLVYGLFNMTLSRLGGATLSSLSHTAWAVALAWIVIACSTGYGGYVESILSASILYPFSRTTYCAYLVHPLVIRWVAMHLDAPMHLGTEMVAVLYFGQLVISFALAFVVSLMFEAPVVSLLRLISPTKRKQKPAA